MVFSSLIFVWIFLPIVFIGYFFVPSKLKNVFLLLASLLFYAWGEPKYILLMLSSILINYVFGLLMDKFINEKKLLLISDIIINIAVLVYFKYFNFFIQIINASTKKKIESPEIALPIGISFFTFQILSYIIDLYRGKYKAQRNIINLALYISFFPQLIAGPIVRYEDIDNQLKNREQTLERVAEGIRRFIYGFGKKIILSNTVAQCVDLIFTLDYAELTGVIAWLGAGLYTLQIYYDFSGYSDMAVGLGKMFGFEFLENFRYPYISSSIREFWQRWHISLGTWFREYLYIPLGGNREGKLRTYINLSIVFFLTGLWHGASFNFILWGLYHGLFQIVERIRLRVFLERHKMIAHLYTIIVIVFGWVIFRSDNLVQAGVMVRRMLMPWEYAQSNFILRKVFDNKTILIVLMCVCGSGLMQWLLEKIKAFEKWKNSYLEILYCGIIFIICIAMLANDTYNPFIYFRF